VLLTVFGKSNFFPHSHIIKSSIFTSKSQHFHNKILHSHIENTHFYSKKSEKKNTYSPFFFRALRINGRPAILKSAKNRPKIGQEWAKTGRNRQKWAENRQKQAKTGQNGSKGAKNELE
jgi:hypothetical protein